MVQLLSIALVVSVVILSGLVMAALFGRFLARLLPVMNGRNLHPENGNSSQVQIQVGITTDHSRGFVKQENENK